MRSLLLILIAFCLASTHVALAKAPMIYGVVFDKTAAQKISAVTPRGPADNAGIQPGDLYNGTYLYGGSWEVYSWNDIITGFKKYASENPSADWLTLYINEKNKNFLDGQKPLKISYAINALIVQSVEKERGFAPVMELLTCGKIEKGDENYFKALENVSGITKANFNAEVWKLVRNAK